MRASGNIIALCIPAIAAMGRSLLLTELMAVTFTVYAALGNALDLGRILATLSFFTFIRGPLTILPRLFAVIAAILNSAGEYAPIFLFGLG